LKEIEMHSLNLNRLSEYCKKDGSGGGNNSGEKEGLLLRLTVKGKKITGISLVPSWREDDNFVRLYDPNMGKRKELFEYLQSVNENGAGLKIVGKEIIVEDFQY